ncbi:MAG: hypothetical protein PHD70_12180, partial [Anaerostipes sp.]|nr:hypothetical protein [Anaerostipes sp.]
MEQKKKVYLNPVQVITIALFLFFVFGVKVQAEQKYVEELKIDNVYIVLAGEVQDSSEFPQGVSYSEATNTLTLDNVNVEKVQGTGTADLNIIIKNTSIVQKDIFYGADSEEEKGGNINISGGKLQFTKELYGYARISTFEDDGVSVQGNINLLNMTIESNNGYNLLHTNKGNVSIKNCIIKMTNGSGNAIITQGDQAKISISNSSIETIYSSLANIYYTMMQPEITGMHCYVGEEKAEYEMNKNDFFKEYNYDYSPYIHHVNFAYVGKYTLLTTEDKHLPQAYRVSVDVDEISSAQVSRCY